MQYLKFNFTAIFKVLAISIILFIFFTNNSFATAGINGTINFQGKVVDKTTGTNVADNNYDFEFRLYDAATSGSLLWTETRTGGNQVTVTDGIFRVALGSVTSLSTVDFNSDSIYLEIDFNGETFTSERIRLAAVPYAFSAQEVNGLSVTNNGGNTLNIAANKTFTVSNTLTLAGTDGTSFTFPTTGGGTVLVTNISGQAIAGSFSLTGTSGDLTLAGTTGLTFSGAGGQITFTNGETIDNDTDGILKFTAPNASFSGTLTVGQGQTIRSEYGPLQLAYKSGGDAWTTGLSIEDTTGRVIIPGLLQAAGTGSLVPYSRIGEGEGANVDTSDDLFVTGDFEAGGGIYTEGGGIYSGVSLQAPILTLGSDAAAAGTLRLPNNTYITTRNAANSADINLIKINASNLVEFGANTAAFTLGGAISGNSQNITALSGVTINGGGTIDSATSGTLGLATTTNTTGLTIGNSGVTSGLTFNIDTAANYVFQKEGSAYSCSGTDKLTLNDSGQLVCAADQGGAGGGGNEAQIIFFSNAEAVAF